MNQSENRTPLDGGTGYIKVRVTTALGAIPLEGATVTIRGNTDEFSDVIRGARTNRDGVTETIALPTKNRSLSSTPTRIPPYATYNIDVLYDGYYSQFYQNVPVFDGITAIQNADMVPLSENGQTDNFSIDGQRFFESQSPDLLATEENE
jgi:hypothetical protein